MVARLRLCVGFLLAAGILDACVSSVGLSAGAVVGGGVAGGVVSLTEPAPAGGFTVELSSSNPNAQVNAHATVPAGETSAAFRVSTLPVTHSTSATISASGGGCSAIAGVSVHPAVLAGLSLAASASHGNAAVMATAILTGPAPSGGAVVTLQSTSDAVSVPERITIPAGQSSTTFTLTTGLSLTSSSVAIIASYGGSVQSALLSVSPGI
jgi:hypothetical protein